MNEINKLIKSSIDATEKMKRVGAKVVEIISNAKAKVQLQNNAKQEVTLLNKTGEILTVGDFVWIHYWGTITSGYIALRNGIAKPNGDNGVGKFYNDSYGEIFNEYRYNIASGYYSHAEGQRTTASGDSSHSEGDRTTASGDYSHAEGAGTTASGDRSHAEGQYTTASGGRSHSEGSFNTAIGDSSHTEGQDTTASGDRSHAEGHRTTASGDSSHTEGQDTTASGDSSHAEGQYTTASAYESHAEGQYTTASGDRSHAEGQYTTASGHQSHSEGDRTTASGDNSHAEGAGTTASAYQSHAEGSGCRAEGVCSHAEGNCTIAKGQCSHVQGRYNIEDTTDTYVDIIGWGQTDTIRSNIFTVSTTGNVSASGTFSSGGADYAEWWEWQDGNPNNEDRRGLFVTLNGDKLVKANNNDWILGIVSATPSVIGDNYDDEWQGKYLRDIFGEYIYEEIQTEIKDEIQNTAKIITEKVRKLNPDYDDTKPYVSRNNRKEWSCIGTGGKIIMVDDGTCEVDGWCKPNANGAGIATKSDTETKYRVIKRIDKTHIKIWIW